MSRSADIFNVETVGIPGGTQLVLSGPIDEHSKFPEAIQGNMKRLVLDLSRVTLVNSFGVRLWMRWSWAIEKLYPEAQIDLEGCTHFFVKQILIFIKN